MGRLSKLAALRSSSRDRARSFIMNQVATLNVFCPTGKGGGSDPTCSPKGKPSVTYGPKSSKDIKTLQDLKTFASPLRGPELFTHAVRRSHQLESIKTEGIKTGKNGKVSTTLSTEAAKGQIDSHGVRDTGSGYVVFESRGLKSSFKTDRVSDKESYPEYEFESVPKSNIVKIVGTVTDKTGHTIREDHLAAFAASNQGIDKKQIQDLPEEYQRWFNLSPTANAAKKSPSPLQVDPSRTATIQRAFEEQFNRRFKTLQAAILSFAASDFEPTINVFCPTGKGGGIDSSCSLSGGKSKSSGLASKLKEVTLAPMATGGSLSVASAVKLQKSLHELYTTSKDFKSAVDMIKEQTVTDVRANLIQTIVRSGSKGKDPTKDKAVLKAVDKYNEIEDNEVDTTVLKSLSSKVQGYLNVLDEAPKSDFVIYRGQKKTKSVVGDEIEFDVPSSMSQSKDVATHYAGGELLIIRPGVKYLSTDLLAGASEGLKGGVAEHRSKRVGYEKQQVYFNASMGTDEEIIAKGKFKVLSVKEDRVSYEDQLTGKQKSKSVRILELEPIEDSEPIANAFKFQTSEAKLQNFEQWLVSKLSETMEAKDIHRDTDWWQTYIDQAYQQGSSRAYDSATSKGPAKDQRVKDQSFGAKRQFFSTPGSAQLKERLKLVAARTYKGMKGLTDQMKSQLTLALIDGMLKGENPRKLATRLTETLDISKTRAKMIARTEIIRAHSEGTLATLKALGVQKVGVQVEVAVSGNACPICQKYKNRILTIEEAEGLFPLHPNCFIGPGVKIYTVDGWKPICKIKVGDLVLTHQKRFRKVTQLHRNTGKNVHVVDFSIESKQSTKISITADHPVMVNKVWKAARDIKPGDKVRWMSAECQGCKKPIPFGSKYHNQSCQWMDEAQVANMSKKSSAALLKQYTDGTRNGKETVKAAHEKIRSLILRGEFDAAGASWGGTLGNRNGSKQPAARAKISRSKLGAENAMRTDKDLGRNHSLNQISRFQQDPSSHPNYKMAQKARSGDLSSMSGIERKISGLLLAEGIEAEYNYPVDNLWIDFAIVPHKIAIECDGAYWHQDTVKESKRDQKLEKAGWRVLHLPEKLINSNPVRCLAQITRLILNHEGEFSFYDFEVTSVNHRDLPSSQLYNFSVEEDESYVAKGCVVHNCKCTPIPYVQDSPSPSKKRQQKRIERSIKSSVKS